MWVIVRGQRPPSGAWLLPFVWVREQVCRRFVVECLVGTLVVVKIKIVGQSSEQGCAILEIAGINQFVLERAPQALDEYIVERATAAVHANGDMALFERRQELCRRKLRALVGVPDLGLTEAESGVECGAAEADVQRVG